MPTFARGGGRRIYAEALGAHHLRQGKQRFHHGAHYAGWRAIRVPGRAGCTDVRRNQLRAFIASVAPWQDGDIAVSNCPYLTKGVSTHLPDYHMLKPIFAGDRLIAFAWCFIHSSDMGGIVAGSILPSAYELYQEGIRIPPKKLYRAGVLQEDVRDFMLVNVRIPDKNWGDSTRWWRPLAPRTSE
jgi:hypothetical protein